MVAQADQEALEAAEAEEAIGKGRAKRSEEALRLDRLMAGHSLHIMRLEQVLRLLENDQVGGTPVQSMDPTVFRIKPAGCSAAVSTCI